MASCMGPGDIDDPRECRTLLPFKSAASALSSLAKVRGVRRSLVEPTVGVPTFCDHALRYFPARARGNR